MERPPAEHIAKRAIMTSAVGSFYGWSYSVLNGVRAVGPVLSMGTSWGLLSAYMFGLERLSSAALDETVQLPELGQRMLSHGTAGAAGGATAALLMRRNPVSSVIIFTPIMLVTGLVEHQFQRMRRDRIEQLLAAEDAARAANENVTRQMMRLEDRKTS